MWFWPEEGVFYHCVTVDGRCKDATVPRQSRTCLDQGETKKEFVLDTLLSGKVATEELGAFLNDFARVKSVCYASGFCNHNARRLVKLLRQTSPGCVATLRFEPELLQSKHTSNSRINFTMGQKVKRWQYHVAAVSIPKPGSRGSVEVFDLDQAESVWGKPWITYIKRTVPHGLVEAGVHRIRVKAHGVPLTGPFILGTLRSRTGGPTSWARENEIESTLKGLYDDCMREYAWE